MKNIIKKKKQIKISIYHEGICLVCGAKGAVLLENELNLVNGEFCGTCIYCGGKLRYIKENEK